MPYFKPVDTDSFEDCVGYNFRNLDKITLVFHPSIILEGFYFQKFSKNFIFGNRSDTYIIASSFSTVRFKAEDIGYGPQNQVLVDVDYESDIILGAFLQKKDWPIGAEISIEIHLSFLTKPSNLQVYHRTQSPVFMQPPFPTISCFYGLWMSTPAANGIDVVLKDEHTIMPSGNLVLKMSDAIRFECSGWFLLRSRYTRAGLSLYASISRRTIEITNNSSIPVDLDNRVFQYVTLSTYNFDNLKNPKIITNWTSEETKDQNSLLRSRFGELFVKEKKRKAKIDEATGTIRV